MKSKKYAWSRQQSSKKSEPKKVKSQPSEQTYQQLVDSFPHETPGTGVGPYIPIASAYEQQTTTTKKNPYLLPKETADTSVIKDMAFEPENVYQHPIYDDEFPAYYQDDSLAYQQQPYSALPIYQDESKYQKEGNSYYQTSPESPAVTEDVPNSYDYPQFAALTDVRDEGTLLEGRSVPVKDSWNDVWNDGLDSKVKPAGHKYLESHIADLPFQTDLEACFFLLKLQHLILKSCHLVKNEAFQNCAIFPKFIISTSPLSLI